MTVLPIFTSEDEFIYFCDQFILFKFYLRNYLEFSLINFKYLKIFASVDVLQCFQVYRHFVVGRLLNIRI